MKHHYIKFKSYSLLYVALSGCLSSACSQFIKIDDPIDRITTNAVFTDEATATSAVMGLYAKMLINSPTITSGATTIYAGLTADELSYTGSAISYRAFLDNQITEGEGVIANNFWRFGYEYIYHANTCIESLSKSTINKEIKDQLLGEVYTLRAFCYWYLTHLFGDVPLLLTPDYEENSTVGRTAKAQIIAQITSDLGEAYGLLKEQYFGSDRERINKWTAAAFLARAYLYQQRYDLAVQYATEVMNQNSYKLEENLNNVFLISSEEAIWRLVERTDLFRAPRETAIFIPTIVPTSLPLCPITQNLLDAFEVNDQRLEDWTASKTVRGAVFTYPFKFKSRDGSILVESIIPFRLGEVFLIRSEAYLNLELYNESLHDLNRIRNRAGLENLVTVDPDILAESILQERRIELFGEWGHRWFDLKRIGKISDVLSLSKPNWSANATLWPIPYSQRLRNPNLTQNDGYEQ